jgi:IS30 family transposase
MVENRVGLVRWHFLKGMDFAKLSQRDVNQVERCLNNRPMKLLGFQTPSEVFHQGLHFTVESGSYKSSL